MKKMRFTILLLIASLTFSPLAEQVAEDAVVTAPDSEQLSTEAVADPIDLSADVIIDSPRGNEDEANDFLSRVLMSSSGADMAVWRIGNVRAGQAFFGSPDHALEEGVGNAASLIPIEYIVLASGQVGSQICVNGEPKTYLFNHDTHDENTPIGLGESYVFKTKILDENSFPNSDHLDRPYLAQDFAARSANLLSVSREPIESILADPVSRERLVDLVILNAIADAQLAVYAGHNRWLKYTVEILQTACGSDEVLRQEYDRLLEDPRRVNDSLSQNERIVETNADRSAPAVFEFTEKTQDMVNLEMAREVTPGSELKMAEFVLSPNRALVLPNIETAVEIGGLRGRLDELKFVVFEGREIAGQDESENLVCGDKVYMLREDTYGGQRGLGLSYVMKKQWLEEDYYPKPVPDRERFFFTVDFHNHALQFLSPAVGPFMTDGHFDAQRDLVILSALADLQKGLFESNQALVEESKEVLSQACTDYDMVNTLHTELMANEKKVTRSRAALSTQLESYIENEFVFANFAAVEEQEARLATYSAVMGQVVEPIYKSFFASSNGLLVVTSQEVAEQNGLNPFTTQESVYSVFFGREMLSSNPEEVIAAAGSQICSDKVYFLDENAHQEDTPLISSHIMERDWLNPDYFPKSVAGRVGSFYRFDFEANMLAHYDALFADDVTADVIEMQTDLVILDALYDLQRAAFQGNRNAMLAAQSVLQNVCEDDELRARRVASLRRDQTRVLIPRQTVADGHEELEGAGFTPVEFSNRMDVESVSQKMFIAIEGSEVENSMDLIFGSNGELNLGANGPAVRKTRYYPAPGGSSVFNDINLAARAIQSSPLSIDATDYLVFFGQGLEGGTAADQEGAQKSLICSNKVYLVEEDGVFENVSLEKLIIMKRSWLDEAYFPELVGDRQARGSFIQMDFMMHAMKYLQIPNIEDMDEEAKQRLIDLAIMNSLYDLQEAIYKGDTESYQKAVNVLANVCDDEQVQQDQYAELRAERVKVLGAALTAQTIIDRFENSEYEPFDFATIDELKALGALGVPIAANWASVYGNSVATTYMIEASPSSRMTWSSGQAPEGEETIEFPMLVLSGSAGEDSVCDFGYSYFVIPGIQSPRPDNGRPQALYVLGMMPTSELDFEAASFEEMVGVEPGSGVSWDDLQALSSVFTGQLYEARDKGLISYDDEEKEQQMLSGLGMNFLINTYAQFGDQVATEELEEEFVQQLRDTLTAACNPEIRDLIIYEMMGTLPAETPEVFSEGYAEELTGEEIPVGTEGWEPPEGSPLVEALSGGDPSQTPPGGPGSPTQAMIEQAMQQTIESFGQVFGKAQVNSFFAYIVPATQTFYDEGFVPEGAEAQRVPIIVLDDSQSEGELCQSDVVYVIFPGVQAPGAFVLAVLPKSEANVSAGSLTGVLGTPGEGGLTIQQLAEYKRRYQSRAMEARDKGLLRFEDADKQAELEGYFSVFALIATYGENMESILQNRGPNEEVAGKFSEALGNVCGENYEQNATMMLTQLRATPPEVLALYEDELTGDEVPIGAGSGQTAPPETDGEGPAIDPHMSNYVALMRGSILATFPIQVSSEGQVYLDNNAPEGVPNRTFGAIILDDSQQDGPLCRSDHVFAIVPKLAPQLFALIAKAKSDINFESNMASEFFGLESVVNGDQLITETQSLMRYVFEARDKGVFQFDELEKNNKLIAALTVVTLQSVHAQAYQLLENPLDEEIVESVRGEMKSFCGEDREAKMSELFEEIPQTPQQILQLYRSELPADWQPIGEPMPQGQQ